VIASVVAASLGAALGWWSWWVAAAAICVEALAHTLLQRRSGAVLASAELVLDTLGPTVPLLRLLERAHFDAPGLAALTARLGDGGPASQALPRLSRSLERIDSLRHELVAMYGYALLWPAREALAVEQWRLRHGARLAGWLQALGEFEALLSIAGYADEHPDHAFAELLPAGPPSIEAEGLGHPLLAAEACVRNDLRLGGGHPRLQLLSGANMAGKSTWLRTIGLAVIMAQAGVPVRARRLRLTPLSLGVSIDGGDSLLDGESRFLAEVLRLRSIYALAAEATPALFLVDELLSGTNPQDRIVGAGALLKGLLSRGAIGLCSTHDLELTRLADQPSTGAANAHFASELAEGTLRFDYRLRPGVVGRSNALDLMRSVGLEV
jgi:DNA mismatch repair ATPase MutS